MSAVECNPGEQTSQRGEEGVPEGVQHSAPRCVNSADDVTWTFPRALRCVEGRSALCSVVRMSQAFRGCGLKASQPDGLQRPRVVTASNSNMWSGSEADFNRQLKLLFLMLLVFSLIQGPLAGSYIWMYAAVATWLLMCFRVGSHLLAVSAFVLAVTLLDRVKKINASARRDGEEAQAASAPIQQV